MLRRNPCLLILLPMLLFLTGQQDCSIDQDGDGWTVQEGDCDDTDEGIHPGAAEQCDGLDNDCDGQTDEDVATTYYADADGDGYGDPEVSQPACSQPAGYVDNGEDCDDSDASVHPGASDAVNGLDDDCDGIVDETVDTVAAGYAHSLAITGPGDLRAWGDNEAGQLGDGTTTNRTTPVEVVSPWN